MLSFIIWTRVWYDALLAHIMVVLLDSRLIYECHISSRSLQFLFLEQSSFGFIYTEFIVKYTHIVSRSWVSFHITFTNYYNSQISFFNNAIFYYLICKWKLTNFLIWSILSRKNIGKENPDRQILILKKCRFFSFILFSRAFH